MYMCDFHLMFAISVIQPPNQSVYAKSTYYIPFNVRRWYLLSSTKTPLTQSDILLYFFSGKCKHPLKYVFKSRAQTTVLQFTRDAFSVRPLGTLLYFFILPCV